MMDFAGEKFNLTPQELLKVITGNAGNFLEDLQSGKFNYSNQGPIEAFPDPKDVPSTLIDNVLNTKWNYSNMGEAIADEKAKELEKINQLLGLPATRGNFLE